MILSALTIALLTECASDKRTGALKFQNDYWESFRKNEDKR